MNTTSHNNAALVSASLQGQPRAFEELVRRHQNLAYGYALSLLGDFALAQDAVQESFLVAHQRLDSLQDADAFGGWLRGIVYRRCLRCVRTRKRPWVPLDEHTQAMTAEPEAERAALAKERRDALLEAVAALPQLQRAVVTLYYLQEHSQKTVADFLGIPVTSVNNHLHTARARLKGRLKTMTDTTNARLGESFTQRVGTLIETTDALATGRTTARADVQALDLLTTDDDRQVLIVQRLSDGTFKGIARQPLSAGDDLHQVAAPDPFPRWLGDDHVRQAAAALNDAPRGDVMWTGIKAVDLFCPVRAGASVGILGRQGVGRLVFTSELIHRRKTLHKPLTLLFFVPHWTVLGTQDALTHEPGFKNDDHGHLRTAWIVHPRGQDPTYAQEADYLDTAVYFSPLKAAQGLWPAIDPLHCRSNALTPQDVGRAHCELVQRAIELLRRSRALMHDAQYLEHFIHGAHHQAKARLDAVLQERMETLDEADKTTLLRARRLDRYLTQPFEVAADFTGKPGVTVSVEEALTDLSAILDGAYDHVDEAELMWRGAVDSLI